MHPVLFNFGSFQLPTYGFLLVLAILTGVYTAMRLGRREGLDTGQILDFVTWILVVALVGAKVLMVVTDWSFYWHNPREIFSAATLMAGGVFYGGFIAAVLFSLWYIRVHRLPFWKHADVIAPGVAIGQTIGRLGCFSAGCDYGKPTTSGWGVIFTNPYSHQIAGVPLGIPLYPTQLFESAATLAIFGILLWRYNKKRHDGEIFLLYMALYAVARFLLEFLRGDADRGFVFNHLLSTSQFIALLALVAVAILAFRLPPRSSEKFTGGGTEAGFPSRGRDKGKRPDEAVPTTKLQVAGGAPASRRERH